MNAVIYHSYDDIRLENRSVPSITDAELLVKVHGCGLCGSDILKIAQHALPPVVLGHELTGTIVARGRTVTGFEVGQRVVVAHHVPCGACHYCRHGNESMCASFKASNIDPCGFAEYIRVPAEQVQQTTLPLPATLSDEEGSFVEPLACCVRAVKRTPLLSGDTVLIMGLGSIGLLMLQAVRASGAVESSPFSSDADSSRRGGGSADVGRGPLWSPASPQGRRSVRVFGVDLLPDRLQTATELGADAVFPAALGAQGLCDALASYTEGRGVDAVVLTAPGARPFAQALASVRKGGIIHVFAAHAETIPFDLGALYQQELTILSTYSSSPPALRAALALLLSHAVRVDGLISHRLPLQQFAEGVSLMQRREALKVYFQIAGEF